MVDRTMRGLYPILAMPFDDQGRIDTEDLQREVEFALDNGAHGVGIALGSEIMMLSEAERDLAITTVVGQVNGRVSVVVNTGAQATEVAVQYSRNAEELGANAVMVMPPTNAGSSDLVRDYFARISDAINVPIFIQDTAAAPVAPSTQVQMAREISNVAYSKVEVPPSPPRVTEAVALAGDDLIVFGGIGGTAFVEELRRGAVGTMPHTAFPDFFRRIWDLFQEGDDKGTTKEFHRLLPLLRATSHGNGGSNMYLVKELLRLRGVFKAVNIRFPLAPPDDLAYAELRELVESMELTAARV